MVGWPQVLNPAPPWTASHPARSSFQQPEPWNPRIPSCEAHHLQAYTSPIACAALHFCPEGSFTHRPGSCCEPGGDGGGGIGPGGDGGGGAGVGGAGGGGIGGVGSVTASGDEARSTGAAILASSVIGAGGGVDGAGAMHGIDE